MREKGKFVLWPQYFNTHMSRRDGRRLPKVLAISGVKTEEIYQAAIDLNLNPILQSDSAYPKNPWMRIGAVLIDKTKPKTSLLKDLAKRIRERRNLK